MKNYNKILEAINRGINLALDNFDDEIVNQTNSSKIKVNSDVKKLVDLKKNFVDLGLPSGTIWCKYNLGANYDLIINHPEDTKAEDWCGDYYAFGELEPKTTKYKFKEWVQKPYGLADQYTKYNMEDKIMKLELCDDPAYNNNPFKELCGVDICLPTAKLCEELIKYTKPYYHYNLYAPNLYTCTLKSIINGEELIFPKCGFVRNKNKENLEKTNTDNGYYMSSYIVPQQFSWLSYNIEFSDRPRFDTITRDFGVNVKPVLMK